MQVLKLPMSLGVGRGLKAARFLPSAAALSYRDNRDPLSFLLACLAAVLLIACTNVANLQLALTVTRKGSVCYAAVTSLCSDRRWRHW